MICWQTRGCDEEMSSRCPHAVSSTDGMCPAECRYTDCDRAQHERETDILRLLDPDVDRSRAVKEACLQCRFFLANAR